jgi:hypothetical protein
VRRILVIALIVGAALLSTAGTSQAAARWPARCSNFKCVNAHLNALHKSVQSINSFLNCFRITPTTEYGNFLSDDGVNSTTGLDFTATGDSIDFWMLGINPGTCGTPTTAIKSGKIPLLARPLMLGAPR